MPYIGNIVQDFSVNNAMLNTDSVTSIKIDDGTIVNADINDSAAIAMSKLALSITNSEINASAAIAVSKLANFVTNNADNRLITGSGSTNTLNGESGLTFDGTTLDLTASSGKITINSTGPAVHFIDTNADSDFMAQADGGLFKLVDLTNSDATRLVLNSSGQVGINETNPTEMLHIKDDGNTDSFGGLIIKANNNSVHMKYGWRGLDANSGGDIRFAVGGTEMMRVLSSGKVGLGRTSADEMLHIKNDDNTDGFGGIKIDANNGSIQCKYGWLGVDGSNSFRMAVAGTERMRVASDGKVGIGTTSPSHALHVVSNGTDTAFFKGRFVRVDGAASSDSPRVNFSLDGTDKTSLMCNRTDSSLSIETLTAAPIIFDTNSTERMRIHSSTHQVQIGGTTLINSDPYLTLGQSANSQGNVFHMVNNGTADLKMAFISANKNSRAVGIDVSTDNFFIGRDSSDIDLTITNSGKVGIGTASPTSTLQVDGDIRTTNRLGVGTAANFANIVSYISGTGSYPPSGGLVQADNADSTAMFWNASNSANYTGLSIECRTTGAAYWMLANVYNSSFSGDLAFRTRTGGSSNAERVRFLRGGGITFNGDTSSDNALDDYEEGSLNWELAKSGTPSLGSNNGSNVKYVKVGRLVHISGRVRTDSCGSAGGDNFVFQSGSTLPFTPETSGTSVVGHWRSQDQTDNSLTASIAWVGSSTTLYLYTIDAKNDYAADTNNVPADSQTNLVITFSLTYRANS